MIIYEGIFFISEEIEELIHSQEDVLLPMIYKPLHITFKYRPKPEELFDNLVGSEIQVLIVGYGCDGKNSGFEVLLPDDIKEYYINIAEKESEVRKTPHITASLAPGARAANTSRLQFIPLSEPISITGKFGYYVSEKGKEFISFESRQRTKVKKIELDKKWNNR